MRAHPGDESGWTKLLVFHDRDFLAAGFVAHPGSTVTDRAQLSAPVETQEATYVTLSLHGPAEDADGRGNPETALTAPGWRRKHLVSGHWPMLSAPEETADLLAAEVRHYTTRAA
ncbi:hypothetical protein [Microbacterium amylolyticum]|uniref:Uncharacterized protein n=1 Tax=Microbacterium amylolyticum TaxID=936337 RepID=A0ABS4ZF64_9MICO|nr:hypothetical protein [Microbacterium amylolyticum]MBP2435920.1 hypothetical protein [Microbacterium amylolyticum]